MTDRHHPQSHNPLNRLHKANGLEASRGLNMCGSSHSSHRWSNKERIETTQWQLYLTAFPVIMGKRTRRWTTDSTPPDVFWLCKWLQRSWVCVTPEWYNPESFHYRTAVTVQHISTRKHRPETLETLHMGENVMSVISNAWMYRYSICKRNDHGLLVHKNDWKHYNLKTDI